MVLLRVIITICIFVFVACDQYCLQTCKSNDDCSSNPVCKTCIDNVCGATCYSFCTEDLQCSKVVDCHSCIGNQCRAPNPKCLGACSVDQDCVDPGHSECSTCNNMQGNPPRGACGSACSAFCSSDSQCNIGLCPYCVQQQCTSNTPPPTQCDKGCSINDDCQGMGNCNYCDVNVCKAACNSVCSNSEECSARCPFCFNGICSTATPAPTTPAPPTTAPPTTAPPTTAP
eukprot:PhF_6_TR37757/c0_g1_i1/m.56213